MDRINAQVFVAVTETGSFRKAADKLDYTQAGISYIVNSMEEKTGFRLFEREFGGVQLTREGEMLLPHMRSLLVCEESLEEQIHLISGLQKGRIRLISFNTVIVCWLPDILKGFKAQYPGIEIELSSCEGAEEGIRMIREKEADLGFLATDRAEGIELLLLRDEPDVAVVAPEHPMAEKDVFPLDQMGDYPFIGYPEKEAPYVYEMARKHGIVFDQLMTVDNDYGNLSMISQNLGYGIYPKVMAERCKFDVRLIPIEGESHTPVALGIRSYEKCSLAAKAFTDYVLACGII